MTQIFTNYLSSNLKFLEDKPKANLRFDVALIGEQLCGMVGCCCLPLDRILNLCPQATIYLSLQETTDIIDSLKVYQQLGDLLVEHSNPVYLCSSKAAMLRQLKKVFPNINIGVPIHKKMNFNFLGEVDFFSFDINEWPAHTFTYLNPVQQQLARLSAGKKVFVDHCNSSKDFTKYLEIQGALYQSDVSLMSDCVKNIAPCLELYQQCEYRMQAYKILSTKPKR